MKNKKFIIGLDARPLSTRISGVGRLISEILYAFPDKENYIFYLYSHLPIHETHKKILDLPNIHFKQGKGLFAKKGALYFNFYLPYHIYKEPIDLFWGSQQILPPFLPPNIPSILTYCDLVLYLYPGTMRKMALIQQKIFQKYSIYKSSFILTISEQTRKDLLNQFKYDASKTDVTYPGVDIEEINKLLNSESKSEIINNLKEPFLLSVSTIEPRKNYPFLLDVFRSYRKLNSNKKLKWVIVGKIGWEKEKFIEELMFEISTYKDIILIQNANDIDLFQLYKKSFLFLFASYYEGFGIPLLEALACNKYAIVSDLPTFREIGKENITYLKLDNPEEWAKKIIELENYPVKLNQDISEFTWKNASIKTYNIFEKFLK